MVDPAGVITAFGLAPASSDERPIADALVASDRHEAYLADKGFTGVEWERRWLEEYGLLVAATPYEDSRRAWSKAERRWASFARQTPDHRRGDLPTQGFLRVGGPPGENVGRAAGSLGGQARGLHLRPTAQRYPGPTETSAGRPLAIAHCTSGVLERRLGEVRETAPSTTLVDKSEKPSDLCAVARIVLRSSLSSKAPQREDGEAE